MPDFADIPGMKELWNHTKGDSRIIVAVLDSEADLERSCFQGSNLTKIQPYWHDGADIDPELFAIYQKINNSDEKSEVRQAKIKEAIPDEKIVGQIQGISHATHVCSNIFGQPNTPVEGIAPLCRGINIPVSADMDSFIDPINLARAINLAVELGANIIHCAACRPTQTAIAEELLEKAVRQAQESNVLIVAPTGNDKDECWCLPAVMPGVLGVGALKDEGQPFKFSNWSGPNKDKNIIAPGENILGTQPHTEETIRTKGTSCAAPIITALSALLMSLQLKQGASPDAEAVRAALTNSAIPCDSEEIEEPERCMLGKVNISGAYELLTGNSIDAVSTSGNETNSDTLVFTITPSETIPHQSQESGVMSLEKTKEVQASEHNSLGNTEEITASAPVNANLPQEGNNNITATETVTTANVTPSAGSNLVYVLGTLGYDFGTEARRDSFKQLMPTVAFEERQVPPNPYDARQMVDYLDNNLFESKSLIWTLNLELTPIYALKPVGAFADETYEMLLQLLNAEVLAEHDPDYCDRISLSGRLTNETVKLFSGQTIPVMRLYSPRGIYGWTVNSLVENALATVSAEREEAQEQAMRKSLTSFLQRIYYDLRNVGQTDRDRALNFAATNAFQAVSCISEAVAIGMEIHSIEVEKSPFCRYDSNCWDVKLKFFDPENGRRAKKLYRFTIDVVDLVPVTLGKVRSWSVPK